MALVKQNVANNPIGSYPVGVFKTADNTELQAVVVVDTAGSPTGASGNASATHFENRVNVTTASTTILAAYTSRIKATITNLSDTDLYLSLGNTAVVAQLCPLSIGSQVVITNYIGAINAIHAASGNKSVAIVEL